MLTDTTLKRLNTIGELSKQGKKINGLFRLMENSALWKQAYTNISAGHRAVTKGINDDTLDGFSYKRAENIIKQLKANQYKFNPVRRTCIPKKNGKLRPLGIPSGNDKIVQEVTKIILEEIYEPIFINEVHGFRPNRSCHTALTQVKQSWTGVKWLIEMDIKNFSDHLDHKIMIQLLERKIEDKRFIKLICDMLEAGYMENWQYHKIYNGTIQGGNISSILSNIYLHELDSFMKATTEEFNQGSARTLNPEYNRETDKIYGLRKKYQKLKSRPDSETKQLEMITETIKETQAKRETVPYGGPYDPNYRRLVYNRYADDFIIGIIGSKREAKEIASKVRIFLKNVLNIQIEEDKFKINDATQGINYLGFIIKSCSGGKVLNKEINEKYTGQWMVKKRVQLIIPEEKLWKFAKDKGYGDYYKMWTVSRSEILHGSDAEIIATYNAELRGLVNYYSIGHSAKKKLNKIVNMGRSSCAKTLANKHKMSTKKMIRSLKRPNGEWVRRVEDGNKVYEYKIYRLKTDFIQIPLTYD